MAKKENTSKPKEIGYSREFTGQHGKVHVFTIEFENGDTGEFTTTKRDQTKFTVGEETLYSIEEREDNRGNIFFRVDKVSQKPAGTGNGGQRSMSKEVEQSIIASVCLDCAAQLILKAGKDNAVQSDLVALHVMANKFYDYIIERCKGDRQLSINYQSRLKEVVNILIDYKSLKIESSDDILKYVELEVAYLQSKMK